MTYWTSVWRPPTSSTVKAIYIYIHIYAHFLPQECCNYKCFGISFKCIGTTQKSRRKKTHLTSFYTKLQKSTRFFSPCLVCATPSMEKRKKSRELSGDLRSKTVEKYQQCQRCKSISRDLKVPLSTVCNIIKKFITHGTVANLPRRGRKRKNWWKNATQDTSNRG